MDNTAGADRPLVLVGTEAGDRWGEILQTPQVMLRA